MAIDTLAYAKALEAADIDRQEAEAHAEALSEAPAHHVLPDLATKADLDAHRAATKAELDALEHRLMIAIERQTVCIFGMVLGVVGLLDAILFALLRFIR
jgi:hypothetical protein